MDYYKVKELHNGIYSIHEPAEVFCYLLVGEKSALLYDTTFGLGDLAGTVRGITDLPLEVVLSHGHYDHGNGATQFEGAYIHPRDEVLCLKHSSRTGRRAALEKWVQKAPENLNREAYIHAGSGELTHVEIGQVFDLGGMTVEVVALEGHTAGSVGLLVRERRILLASDALGPHIWMFLEESLSMKEYINMLTRIQGLPFDTFYIGHSDIPRPISEIELYKTVALNADAEKSEEYYHYKELGPLLYQEGDVGIVFNPKNMGRPCENVAECPCPRTECPRYKKCCVCIKSHRERDYLPYCVRPKE
ncbi:MAG: MBL fold metallo-hydrolase [Defluviitaleaceae bacterium]|nr:MBL fold metallo-hydrolase [Defluviitaleaceae bacterium]